MWHLENEKNASHLEWMHVCFLSPLRTVVCAAWCIHSRHARRGGGGLSCGAVFPRPAPRPAGNIPQLATGQGRRKVTHFPASRYCWDPHGHHFTCSPFNWPFMDGGQENVTKSLIQAHLEEKAGTEAASSLWGLSPVVLGKFSGSLGGSVR